jgi:uncharacterized phiE125 gp8 family phage protein
MHDLHALSGLRGVNPQWNVTTPPSAEPLAAADLRRHLNITATAEDPHLEALLLAARQLAEQQLAMYLCRQTVTLTMDRFPWGRTVQLARAPVAAVTSIQYRDDADALQTVDTADYWVDLDSRPARVEVKVAWPIPLERPAAVRFTLSMGYADPEDIPQPIRQALLMIAGHWYEQREAASEVQLRTVPIGADRLLSAYRQRWGA